MSEIKACLAEAKQQKMVKTKKSASKSKQRKRKTE